MTTNPSNNSSPLIPEGKDILLIDYYCATVATVGGDGYDEMTLSTFSADKLRLNVYHRYEGDPEERAAHYLVPISAAQECYQVIEQYHMRDWFGMTQLSAMCGAIRVCKFRDGDRYIRVSTEAMPDNGEAAISAVDRVLSRYTADIYRIEE